MPVRDSLRWQASLFALGEPSPDRQFRTATRHDLGDHAWVEHVPGWLEGSDQLFTHLLDRLHWSAKETPMYGQLVTQPRLSAWWSLTDEQVREPLVAELAGLLGQRYGSRFTSVGANLYRTGADSVAWHGDRHARDAHDPDRVVAVLSLGAPRRFAMRARTGGGSCRFRLGPGDLLVMGGSCQRTWQHAVPKVAEAGPRISVTFRDAPVGRAPDGVS